MKNRPLHIAEHAQGNMIVFLHGFPFDHSMWQDAVQYLGDAYHLVFPDLRGFGKTQLPVSSVTTMSQFADDVAALADSMADGTSPNAKIVVCGLSMGGYVAMHFAKKFGDRLAGLILCDTKSQADSEAAATNRKRRADALPENGLPALADAMIPNLFAPQTAETVREKVRQMILRQPIDGVAAADRGMAERPDTTEWLTEITCPTLVVCGKHDVISTVDEMKDMAERIPNAHLSTISNAGHLTPLESPAEFYQTVKIFLNDLTFN